MPRADMAPLTRTVLTVGAEEGRLPRSGCVSRRTGHRGTECPWSRYDLRSLCNFGLGVPGLRPHWTPFDSPTQGRVSSPAQPPRLGLGCGWLTGHGHRSGDPRPATAGQTGSSSEFCNLEIKKQVLLATPLRVLCDMVWYCFSLNHCRRRQCRCTGLCRTLQDGQPRAGRNPSLPDHSCPGLRRELRVCVRVYVCITCVCVYVCIACIPMPTHLLCAVGAGLMLQGQGPRQVQRNHQGGTSRREAGLHPGPSWEQPDEGSCHFWSSTPLWLTVRPGDMQFPGWKPSTWGHHSPTGAHRHGQEASRWNEGLPALVEMCLPLPRTPATGSIVALGRRWICWVSGPGLHPGHTCIHRCAPLDLTQLRLQVLGWRCSEQTVTHGEKWEGAA